MAQFRSSSREGSFKNNLLIQPNTISRIQEEGKRRLANLDSHQQALTKQRNALLQAQKVGQNLQSRGAERAFKVEQQATSAAGARSERLWNLQLAEEEAKNKFKVDKLGALVNFSKTAIDLTNNIVKANKENQLRAINQIQFKNNFSYQDIVDAASVDQDISRSEFIRTNVVKTALEEGKSQEFINTMYDHLVKGGGYRNYMNNKAVLDQLSRQNAAEIMLVVRNKALSVEQREEEIAKLEARQRGQLTINGEIPKAEFLEVAYNQNIRKALNKATEVLNGAKSELLQAETARDQAITVNSLYESGGAEAVFQQVGSLPNRQGAIRDAVQVMVSGRQLTPEQIEEIERAQFVVNGQNVNLVTGGYVEALALLESEYNRAKQKRKEDIATQAKLEELEIEKEFLERYQEAYSDERYTKEEHDAISQDLTNKYGIGRSMTIDSRLEKETVSAQLKELMRDDLQRRAMDGTLTKQYMLDNKIPVDLFNSFSQFADRNEKVKADPLYKAIAARVRGAIAATDKFKFIDGKFQSDAAQWYLNHQTNIYKDKYRRAVLGGATQQELNSILDMAATDTTAYIDGEANFGPEVGIRAYDEYMAGQKTNQLAAERKISKMLTLFADKSGRTNPNEWINTIGEAPLIEAVEEFRTTGDNVFLRQLGSELKKTPLQIANELAGVSDKIDPVVVPDNYQEMLESWTPKQRFTFTSRLASIESKIRETKQLLNDASPMPTRPSFQVPTRESFEPQGSATDALLDKIISGEGGYDSVNRGYAGDTPGGLPGLSKMTIGEVMELQRTGGYFAMGAPQFIPATLKTAVKDSGLSKDDIFSPDNQRKLALALIVGGNKRPRLAAYLNGSSDNLDAAHEDLALEWASVQGPSGRGAYDGDSAGNYAHTSGTEIRNLLIQMREENLNP